MTGNLGSLKKSGWKIVQEYSTAASKCLSRQFSFLEEKSVLSQFFEYNTLPCVMWAERLRRFSC